MGIPSGRVRVGGVVAVVGAVVGAVVVGGVGCAAEDVAVVDVPDVVVASRGAGGGGRLLALQAFVDSTDYLSAERFDARLRALFDSAVAAGMLDDHTVVVLPEYVGTWLVIVGESPGVAKRPALTDALTDLATAHLGAFVSTSWTAPVDDGDAFAAFTVKAEAMAAAYDDVMGGLARDYGVTLVAGSILLPGAHKREGHLAVVPGEALENVSVVYSVDGTVTAIARKAFPTADEQGFLTPHDDVAVVDTAIGRVGVLVCADAWFPQSYERLAAAGAEFLVVPTFHSGHDIWEEPWGGYSGQRAPDDVDVDDIGVLTEAEAWDKYALAARARALSLRGAVSAPLRGNLWDVGDDGQAFLVDGDGFERAPRVDAPGVFALELAPSTSSSSTSSTDPPSE